MMNVTLHIGLDLQVSAMGARYERRLPLASALRNLDI
jgi:hypothetical protein